MAKDIKPTEATPENSPAADEVKSPEQTPAIAPDKIIASPFNQVALVDKDGKEYYTTKAFYEAQKDAFALTGVKIKE